MSDNQGEPDGLGELRRRAEAMSESESDLAPDMSPESLRELVHELRTHQIELELQNEDLRQAQAELTESHDRYTDLYDFAPVGYATVSGKGIVKEANLTLTTMLGVTRSNLLKRRLAAFIIPEDEDTYYLHVRSVRGAKQRRTCQLRLLRKDAEPMWVELDTIPIPADQGNGVGLRMAIVDIAARKQIEEVNRSLERQIQHTQKLESLGVLAGGIAHDFNNLLMSILGNVSLALEDISPASPTYESLREIELASKRAAELTNQMLAYSGKGHFVYQPINLSELVNEMAHLLEVSTSKKAELTYQLAESLPNFDGDIAQIRQVAMNLIINASEAIGDQGGSIALSTGTVDCDRDYLEASSRSGLSASSESLREGPYVYLEVSDTGCGMDAETIGKMFDPFFTTKFTGRGLGLSALLGIVRGHRGILEVNSQVGKGTRMRVLFPAIAMPQAAITTGVNRPAEFQGGETVLLADDEEAVRTVCKRMLESMGFTVLTAYDGRDALAVFRKSADQIACVLLDLTMPYLDGVLVFHEIHRLRPKIPVILCSGFGEQEATKNLASAGLAAFIQKPFVLDDLRHKIAHALVRRENG